MKKIMFNDKYGLTEAVLRRKKTQTRRFVKKGYKNYRIWQPSLQQEYGIYGYKESAGWEYISPQYKVGEIVAIAQSYNSLLFEINTQKELSTCGFRNKMFVKSELMRHHIQITNIRIEQLQDIIDEDCLKEGTLDFITEWSEKRSLIYENKLEYQHWIYDHINDYDQSFSFCRKCADKEVAKLRKKTLKEHSEMDIADVEDMIFVDGGWTQENESSCYCEQCGKPLQYDFSGNLKEELEFADFDDDAFAYLINQVPQDDYSKNNEFVKKAFAALIDKIGGKGTWQSNPYVFVYDFKLNN